MKDELHGHLILIVGPSGSGQNTLKSHLQEAFGELLVYPISYTTRPIRPGEVEGKVYVHVSKEEFERMIQEDLFFEWSKHMDHYYGMPRSEIEDGLRSGKFLMREVDVDGYMHVKNVLPRNQYSMIFINGGTWDQLLKRILGRAPMSEEQIVLRKENYERMLTVQDSADVVIYNKDGHLDEAKAAIEAAVRNIIEG